MLLRGLAILITIAATITIALMPLVRTIYADAYPDELAKRHALDHCFGADAGLTRLFAARRSECYARYLDLAAPAAASRAIAGQRPAPPANFVDLWQAAGRGRQPQNDVIRKAQSALVAAVPHRAP
jgi:hypothetical protein